MRHQSLWQRRKGRLPAWIPSQKNVLHFSLLSLGYHAGLLCFCGQCCSSLCPRVPVGGCCPVPTLGAPLAPPAPCPHAAPVARCSGAAVLVSGRSCIHAPFFVVHSLRCLLAHDSSVFISVAEVEQQPGLGLGAPSHSFPFLSSPCSIKSNPDFSSHSSGLRAQCCCALPFSALVPS